MAVAVSVFPAQVQPTPANRGLQGGGQMPPALPKGRASVLSRPPKPCVVPQGSEVPIALFKQRVLRRRHPDAKD